MIITRHFFERVVAIADVQRDRAGGRSYRLAVTRCVIAQLSCRPVEAADIGVARLEIAPRLKIAFEKGGTLQLEDRRVVDARLGNPGETERRVLTGGPAKDAVECIAQMRAR